MERDQMSMCCVCWFDGAKLRDEADDLRVDAMRYRWLRDVSLQVLVSGPICVLADTWGTPVQQHPDGDPEIGPARYVTLDGKQLDAAIDAAREAK